ncbi:MAG: hypothetical protein ABL901_08920 [Hyphomicrobiaceae bacterium]
MVSRSDNLSKVLVRKQFLLSAEQSARLKAQAVASGMTETDIVRAGIELALAQSQDETVAWKAGWERAGGLWAGRDDLDAFYEARREARRLRHRRVFDPS